MTLVVLAACGLPIVLYGWQYPAGFWWTPGHNALFVGLGPAGGLFNAFLPPVQSADPHPLWLPALVIGALNILLVVVAKRHSSAADAGAMST